ncbi:MAG: 1,4-alpha-glucan branching protein GlgB, partial [Gammaproteobacteria bacterium]
MNQPGPRTAEPLTDHDVYLFKEGSHTRLHDKLGAHLVNRDGQSGTAFTVWAPNAEAIAVLGDFNDWNDTAHPLAPRGDDSGIWQGFVPSVGHGERYKYRITSRFNGYRADKSDPFAFFCEMPPQTASRVWDLDYTWGDGEWMATRARRNRLSAPWSIYEMHIGSWRRVAADGDRSLSYRELAQELPRYLGEMGYTHVELMPVMEHPFYPSWGYQVTGFFAPSARYGTPQDFMVLVDQLHQHGIGVILDWVPSHFPDDGHGLSYFDGTYLYEHQHPLQRYHPEWKSTLFNYDRHEVRAFLLSSATFWLRYYHADALRVDAVTSMLHLDHARQPGEWIPNAHGGRENLAAVEFLRNLNLAVYRDFPDTQTIAEESSAWPMVSRPVYLGGLGFGMKWNMGWMHDTLKYFAQDPLYRKYRHDQLTFSIWYAFNENFVLALSHDEVVHGKRSLIGRMPGDDWRKFANLRLMFGYMIGHPGKKLLFMGGEIGQWREWAHDRELDWYLLNHERHQGIQRWMRDLNHCYQQEPALYERDFDNDGFEWIDCHDWEQ